MVKDRRTLLIVLMVLALAAASCGDSSDTGGPGDPEVTTTTAEGQGGGDGSDADGGGSDASGAGDGDGASGDPSSGPDNDDAADIVGNPDLDLDELDDDTAEALDAIDDVVSIGDCSSETVGLTMTVVPEGYSCRVLDAPVAGMDGFTLFMGQGGIEITIGTPSPLPAPCEVLQACDAAVPLDVGPDFELLSVELAGIPLIWGTHVSGAEVAITTFSPLSDDDLAFIRSVLDGVQPV